MSRGRNLPVPARALGTGDTFNFLLAKHWKAKQVAGRWRLLAILALLFSSASMVAGLWVYDQRADRQLEHSAKLQTEIKRLEETFEANLDLMRELVKRDVQREEELLAIRQARAREEARGF